MSKFYRDIAKYYDYIFPITQAKIDFIRELAGKPPKDILDVACGSGGYSKVVNEIGHNVIAIDLDEKMIDKLKEKERDIDARVFNMMQLGELQKKFDLIFCIGNSLVHLNNNKEIFQFLKVCKNSLNSRGKLLIQIINYDRVLAKGVKNLPTIKNEEVDLVFERNYEYLSEEQKIDFKTILRVDGQELENNVLLHPIKSKELLGLIKESGFTDIKTYGSFNKDEYDQLVSFPLIVVAE